MDAGKRKSLLDWVNSTGIKVFVEDLEQLSDGTIITDIIKCMQLDESSTCDASGLKTLWQRIKEFLEASNFSQIILDQIQWELLKSGNKFELAKVLLLLLSLTVTCPNKQKLILEMTNLENDTQVHIRHILSEALAEGNLSSSGRGLFDVLMLKAPPLDQTDVEFSDSPARNSPMHSIHGSPTPTHSRSVQMLGRGTYRTPVKQIFKSMEEEEVFFSVPASCPPLRRNHPRHSFQDFPSFNISSEASPVQEFLSSPAVNYRIKIRDLEQKYLILEKNLHAERLAKEECEKLLSENEKSLEQSEKRIRDMSRCSVEKQQLFDEIDELHSRTLERDSLEKENIKLKLRLERYDTSLFETKDLKQDLETQLKENEELLKQVKNLKSALSKVTEGKKEVVDLEEALKNIQETNAQQEQEISHLLTQLHKLKGQNMEQKEHYESRINDYKSMIEEKDSFVFENEGESMGIFMEQRVVELQETMKEMEENWMKPDVAAKIQADLGAAKETMEQYQARLHSASSEKVTLEEEICRLQQDVTARTCEVVDSMKKLMLTNQKIKSSQAVAETLRAQIGTLSGDKESLKSRIKELELEVRDSTTKTAKLQVELNLSINENESNTITIQSHIHRLSESSQKIADYENQCRTLESNLTEMSGEIANLKNSHKSQMESLEKMMANDQRQISKLEEQNKIFDLEKVSSEAELQDLKENLLREKRSLSETRQEEESLKLEVKRYHSACSELEDSCNILGSKLKNSRESSKQKLELKEEELSKLKEEDESKKTRILALEEGTKRMTKDITSKSEELTSYHHKLKEAQDENASLRTERDNFLEEKLRKMRKDSSETEEKMKEAEDENASLLNERDNLEEELQKMRKDSSETEEKLKEAEDENASLLKKRNNLEDELQKMRKDSSETEDKLKEAEDENAFLFKERDNLEEELRKMRKDSSETEEKLKEAENEKASLLKEKDNLEEELRKMRKDSSETEEKLKEAEDENASLLKERDNFEKELQKMRKDFSETEEKLKDSYASYRETAEKLANSKSELRDFKEDHESMMKEKDEKFLELSSRQEERFSSLEKEVQSYNEALDQKSKLLQNLESTMKNLEEEHQSQIKEAEITSLEKEEKILMLEEETSRSFENHTIEISSLRSALEKKSTEHIQLEEHVECLILDNKQKQEDSFAFQEESIKLKESLQETMQNQRDEIARLKEEIVKNQDEYESEFLRRREEVESLQGLLQDLKNEEVVLTEKFDFSAEEVQNLKNENSKALASLQRTSESLELTQRELEEARDNESRLAEQLGKMDELNQHLEELGVAEKEHLENLTKLQDRLEEETELVSILKIKLKESNSDKQEHIAERESRIKSTEKTNTILKDKIKLLEEQMDLDAAARDETVADLVRVQAEVESSKKSHKADLQRMNASIQALQEQIDLVAAARDETVADFIRVKAEVESSEKNHKADLKSWNTSIQALQEQINLVAATRDEAAADFIQVKAEVESSEKNHKADLQSLNASIQALQENLENSKETCRMQQEESTKNKEVHSASYNSLSNELEDSRQCCEKLEVESQDLKVGLGEMENLLKSSQSRVEDLTKQHDKVEEDHKSCLEEIDNLKKNIASLEKDSKEQLDALKSSILEDQAKIESLESELARKHSYLDEVSQAKTSLQEEVESLRILLEKKEEENEYSIKRMEENLTEFKEEKDAAEKMLQESHQSGVEELEEKLKMQIAEVKETSEKLESVAEMWNSEKLESEKKKRSLEMQIEEAKQANEFLKIENESLEKTSNETSRAHSENLQQIRTARDQALNSLESEKDQYNALESRLNKEVLQAENELSEAKNLVNVVSNEKEICEKKCFELETEQDETQKKLSKILSDLEKYREENSAMNMEIESLRDLIHNSDEKLKAVRTQFAEKYREKQEKVCKLEQDLKDWQMRADEETGRYDSMASMYNEKRAQLHDTVNNLDQTREENMDLQEIIRNLKAKNEILATSSSQLNVKKIEEDKKIRSLTTEVHRLDAQLQFAERQIRELRTGTKSFRHSSMSSNSLMPVEEVLTPVRRRSLNISDVDVFSNDNLFRCRSDTYLDSPSTANKKKPKGQNEILDDSLNDVLRTPVSLQTRSKVKSDDTQNSGNHENLFHVVNRGHISFESSLLSASPSHSSRQCYSQSNPQLNSSRMSQESTDVNMSSSNLAEASSIANNTPSTSRGRCASMPRHPSSLAFQTEEEPHDYDFGSLSRLVELQRRNAATLPHLKSSYPIETQGQTPSKCDESVRIGDADGTLRRMTQTSASLQKSLTAGGRTRRMTIDVNNELPTTSDPMRRLPSISNETQLPKRKISSEDVKEANPPYKNRRETKSSSGSISEELSQSRWQGSIPDTEDKEQVDPRRMSMMFEIPNSPRRPQLRSHAARKNVEEKSQLLSASMKTPDKSKMAKKNLDEKKKTPSLMDRMKRPLGRFSKK